ncbi:MAG: hypothetical protein PHO85_00465 [Candidatus Cloacimonetes bacterium]|jgi:hypothetical protein|nr:hypothetical protein [Candidatus Cloacimonadota bacterium]MDD4146979.1 hypothetical protein [Candidatus Cloacimonadota bacterium]
MVFELNQYEQGLGVKTYPHYLLQERIAGVAHVTEVCLSMGISMAASMVKTMPKQI